MSGTCRRLSGRHPDAIEAAGASLLVDPGSCSGCSRPSLKEGFSLCPRALRRGARWPPVHRARWSSSSISRSRPPRVVTMKASITVDIDAPTERVWAVMSDVETWPQMDAVRQVYSHLDRGPLRVAPASASSSRGYPRPPGPSPSLSTASRLPGPLRARGGEGAAAAEHEVVAQERAGNRVVHSDSSGQIAASRTSSALAAETSSPAAIAAFRASRSLSALVKVSTQRRSP